MFNVSVTDEKESLMRCAEYTRNLSLGIKRRQCLPQWLYRSLPTAHHACFRHHHTEAFLHSDSMSYIEQMYRAWIHNPTSVDASWSAYFGNLEKGRVKEDLFCLPPQLNNSCSPIDEVSLGINKIDTIMTKLIQNYRKHGYKVAKVNPLGLVSQETLVQQSDTLKSFNPHDYGLSSKHLKSIVSSTIASQLGFLKDHDPLPCLDDIIHSLQTTYCGSIGIQVNHIKNKEIKTFLFRRLEELKRNPFSVEKKHNLLGFLAKTQLFEHFCNLKFNVMKRFGIEGCESVIVAVNEIVERSASLEIEHIVIGCSHRGRVNLLANVLGKPLQQLFREFNGKTSFSLDRWGNSGDVKYHLGAQGTFFDTSRNKQVKINVLPNPSHLEATNPVTLGYTLALQQMSDAAPPTAVLPLLVHGDASFSAQGVVYEILQMSNLPSYHVNGTIHLIINNQIGFTTDVRDQRSTQYPTEIAQIIKAPIFHVNADDPESCALSAQLALEFRQKFHRDVVLNIIGYRRLGHNELDMPKFTQPLMYQYIEHHPTALELYSKQLLEENVVSEEDVNHMKKKTLELYSRKLEEAQLNQENDLELSSCVPKSNERKNGLRFKFFDESRHKRPCPKDSTSIIRACQNKSPVKTAFATGVSSKELLQIGMSICTFPPWLKAHPTVEKVYKARREALQLGKNIDFGLAEALAFATLIREGFNVRLVGQDSERGTFSHRHAVIHHQAPQGDKHGKEASLEERTYCPLSVFGSSQRSSHDEVEKGHGTHTLSSPSAVVHGLLSKFSIWNSFLSEYAALGFEFGYAMFNSKNLCLWEAQFGDFANGAQIIIDQYIAASETKWGVQCGLVVLLPHGYDGQGPEHSSGRIERFLQLCDDPEHILPLHPYHDSLDPTFQDYNFQVVNCTTPANLFHVLRRQMHRPFRKPLIILTPKRMLRMRATYSCLSEFLQPSHFMSYIPFQVNDEPSNIFSPHDSMRNESITRLILCSGQIYYDLLDRRKKLGTDFVALARIEQLCPFPYRHLMDDIRRYPNLKDILWVQEEHMNMGPWTYISRRISTALREMGFPNGISQLRYVGRDTLAAAAVGDLELHRKELETLLERAYTL